MIKRINTTLIISILLLLIIPLVSSQATHRVLLDYTDIFKDTYIDSSNPNTNYGSSTDMPVMANSSIKLAVITWNLTNHIPSNATNFTATLNLTEGVPANSIGARIWSANDYTWSESGLTYNTFFCGINPNGTINIHSIGACDEILDNITTVGVNNAINSFNVTKGINNDSIFLTLVIEDRSTSNLQWTPHTKEVAIVGERPLLEVWYDEESPPPPPPEPPFASVIGSVDVGSCGEIIDFFIEDEKAYYWTTKSGTFRIGIIDISTPTTPTLLSCNVFGALGNLQHLDYVGSSDTGVDFHMVLSRDFANMWGFNVTGGGLNIIQDKSFTLLHAGGTGGATDVNSGFESDSFTFCEYTGGDYYGMDYVNEVPVTLLTGRPSCFGGLSDGYRANSKFLVMSSNAGNGQSVYDAFDTSGKLIYNDGNQTISQSKDMYDLNGDFLAVSGNTFYLYEYDSTIQNVTSSIRVGAGAGLFQSSMIITPNDVVAVRRIVDGANFNYTLNMIDISARNLTGTLVTVKSIGNGINTPSEYTFPYAYVGANETLYVYEIIPTNYTAGINKKPEITGEVLSKSNAFINESITVQYTVKNPETSSIGEQIYTSVDCDYTESQVQLIDFNEPFNYSAICNTFGTGKAIIGSKNSVNFGEALDLTSCFKDAVLFNAPTLANSIFSFDLYASTNSTASIELIQSNSDELIELTITHLNNQYTIIDNNNNTIFQNISSLSGSQNVPIRFFVNFNQAPTDITMGNTLFYGTNYFSRNSDIDEVYCDATAYCYIGSYTSQTTTNLNDFQGLIINSATGNMMLDNMNLKVTGEYPSMTTTTTLTQSTTCNYNVQGVATTRIYASDTLYGKNYLHHRDLDISVSQSGIAGSSIMNQTIAEAFTSVASLGGYGDAQSLAILSLIFIGCLMFGIIRLVGQWGNTSGAVAGTMGLASMFVSTLFFYFLGWLPLIALILLVTFDALGFAIIMRYGFSGGGG